MVRASLNAIDETIHPGSVNLRVESEEGSSPVFLVNSRKLLLFGALLLRMRRVEGARDCKVKGHNPVFVMCGRRVYGQRRLSRRL